MDRRSANLVDICSMHDAHWAAVSQATRLQAAYRSQLKHDRAQGGQRPVRLSAALRLLRVRRR